MLKPTRWSVFNLPVTHWRTSKIEHVNNNLDFMIPISILHPPLFFRPALHLHCSHQGEFWLGVNSITRFLISRVAMAGEVINYQRRMWGCLVEDLGGRGCLVVLAVNAAAVFLDPTHTGRHTLKSIKCWPIWSSSSTCEVGATMYHQVLVPFLMLLIYIL